MSRVQTWHATCSTAVASTCSDRRTWVDGSRPTMSARACCPTPVTPTGCTWRACRSDSPHGRGGPAVSLPDASGSHPWTSTKGSTMSLLHRTHDRTDDDTAVTDSDHHPHDTEVVHRRDPVVVTDDRETK